MHASDQVLFLANCSGFGAKTLKCNILWIFKIAQKAVLLAMRTGKINTL